MILYRNVFVGCTKDAQTEVTQRILSLAGLNGPARVGIEMHMWRVVMGLRGRILTIYTHEHFKREVGPSGQ